MLLLILISLIILETSITTATEIVATKEWQLLGENDTLPAGLHVRMDMTTGQKWAKILDDDDEETKNKDEKKSAPKVKIMDSVEVNADGAVSSSTTGSSSLAIVTSSENNNDASQDNDVKEIDGEREDNYNYEMMHSVLSKLPKEEQERIGGLPSLPKPKSDSETAYEQRKFEREMLELWQTRQKELKDAEAFIADMPTILSQHIDILHRYQNQHLRMPILIPIIATEEGEEAVSLEMALSTLQELEFQLTDLDMTRDFHTLGGWHVLCRFLTVSSNVAVAQKDEISAAGAENNTSTTFIPAVDDIVQLQTAAAWVIGTAVKNIPEFYPWSVQPVITTAKDQKEEHSTPITPVSLLLSRFRDTHSVSLRSKVLYALGSLLRGNQLSMQHFVVDLDGPNILESVLREEMMLLTDVAQSKANNHIDNIRWKLVMKISTLGHDLLLDCSGASRQEATESEATATTNDQIINAFTNYAWCTSNIDLLLEICSNSNQGGESKLLSKLETILSTLRVMLPHCSQENKPDLDLLHHFHQQKLIGKEALFEMQTSHLIAGNNGDDQEWKQELAHLIKLVLQLLAL